MFLSAHFIHIRFRTPPHEAIPEAFGAERSGMPPVKARLTEKDIIFFRHSNRFIKAKLLGCTLGSFRLAVDARSSARWSETISRTCAQGPWHTYHARVVMRCKITTQKRHVIRRDAWSSFILLFVHEHGPAKVLTTGNRNNAAAQHSRSLQWFINISLEGGVNKSLMH